MIKRLIDTFIRCGATAISIIRNEEMDEVREYLNSLELPIPLDVIVKSTEGSLLSFYEISDRLNGDKFCLSTVDSVFNEEEFVMSPETEATTEVSMDSLLSNWYFVGGVSGGVLLLSVVLGLLLAKSKIKKGFDVYED